MWCATSQPGHEYSCYCETCGDCYLTDLADTGSSETPCGSYLAEAGAYLHTSDTESTGWLCVEYCGQQAFYCVEGDLYSYTACDYPPIARCGDCSTSCDPESPDCACTDYALCGRFCAVAP